MSNKKLILQELFYQFERAEMAYSLYLKDKVYLYALAIRKANNRIYELLEMGLAYFEELLNVHALALMLHYDVWMAQFDELVLQLQPIISTTFVFERYPGSPPFPRESKQAFIEAYKNFSI